MLPPTLTEVLDRAERERWPRLDLGPDLNPDLNPGGSWRGVAWSWPDLNPGGSAGHQPGSPVG